METVDLIFKILQALSIIIASFVAVRGINSWRRQMVGSKKIELAENVLADFYRVQRVIRWVRYPGSMSNEGATRQKIEGETPEQAAARGQYFIPIERLQKSEEVFSRLDSIKYRCQAYFGNESLLPFTMIKEIHDQIVVASHSLSRQQPRREEYRSDEQYDRAMERKDKLLAVIEEGAVPGEDLINKKLDEAVLHAEKIFRPFLDRKL